MIDGSITAWGDSDYGGTGAPSDNGYTKIYSTLGAFAALKADGSITAWGESSFGGTGINLGIAFTKGCACASTT
jgi:aryl-alcohol dehydrogenase-like predicted oxidoreductase